MGIKFETRDEERAAGAMQPRQMLPLSNVFSADECFPMEEEEFKVELNTHVNRLGCSIPSWLN